MGYKIGLVGTHGTGKTALGALVSGELKRRNIEVRQVTEIATVAKEKGLPINENTTIEAQLYILHKQFAQELEYSHDKVNGSKYDVIICDRGPDNYCYLENAVGKSDYALQMTLGHLEIAPYTQLYLLPIVESVIQKGAGVRAMDKSFQEDMDSKIRGFFSNNNIQYQELPIPKKNDSLRQEWVRIIVNQTLNDLGKDQNLFMR